MAINSTSVHLSWIPPDEDQHNGEIRHYSMKILELLSHMEIQLNLTSTIFIYASLHPDYTYRFMVAAVTVEMGPYSDSAVVRMPEDGMHISATDSNLFNSHYITVEMSSWKICNNVDT